MIYILSCEKIENGGGIYSFTLSEKGVLNKHAYFPCDRPMYAVRSSRGLCVLLRAPFSNSEQSGYFYIDEFLQSPSEIKNAKGVVACHLCVDEGDVYIVNYLSGNVVKNGEIICNRQGKGAHPVRQTMPHTHFITKTSGGFFAVCDLGTDTLAFYDSNLTLISEEKVPSGYGIRHLAFSKTENYIYAINELVPSISVFSYDKDKITLLNTIKIPCKNEKANGAGIRISDNGEILYVSLREENVICAFLVNGDSLTHLQTADCGGDSPRDFDIADDKIIVCNEKSENVTVFGLENGLLTEKLCKFHLKNALCVVK
ncbi:MAG: beta-propeller fold lactonase family protein [Clostridia bacterium]|nr:beta-propeller fold lactonase family protein [Clostridia bacterium]